MANKASARVEGQRLKAVDPHLEVEYNNRQKVPEHPAIMEGWRIRAAALRSDCKTSELDVRYGSDARQTIDIFWPDAHRAAPLALFIHGGYWQALDKSWFSHLARGFLAHGVALAIPSYRLCPTVNLATVVSDVRNAAALLMQRYRCNLHVSGHSAGGHMAAMLLATDWPQHGVSHRVTGGCAISGLFDLVPLVRTSINVALKLDDNEARALSPILLRKPNAPFIAYVGSREGEEYLRQSSSMAHAWSGNCHVLADADHFTAIAPLEDPDSTMMRNIVAAIVSRG